VRERESERESEREEKRECFVFKRERNYYYVYSV
jgi:hypothetical protein